MKVKDLKDILSEYPDYQFVYVRILFCYITGAVAEHVVVDKVQQGTDGAALITVTVKR